MPDAGDHGQSIESQASGTDPAATTKGNTQMNPDDNVMPTLIGVTPPPPVHSVNECQGEETCLVHGHDYEHIVTGAGDLVQIICSCCGRAWRVEET